MKRQYKTLREKRMAWYNDDEYIKAFYLVLALVSLIGLAWYAAG